MVEMGNDRIGLGAGLFNMGSELPGLNEAGSIQLNQAATSTSTPLIETEGEMGSIRLGFGDGTLNPFPELWLVVNLQIIFRFRKAG